MYSFLSPCLRSLGAYKTGFNLIVFHFNIRGKLSVIRCDNCYYLPLYPIFLPQFYAPRSTKYENLFKVSKIIYNIFLNLICKTCLLHMLPFITLGAAPLASRGSLFEQLGAKNSLNPSSVMC